MSAASKRFVASDGHPRTEPSRMELEALPRKRVYFRQLDALRGIAALMVVFSHWTGLWMRTPNRFHAGFVHFALMSIFDGHTAVVVFFLLSGFVLSLPQLEGRPQPYRTFLIRRVCRIYLPYLFALFVAVLACVRFHGSTAYGDWFHQTWPAAPDWKTVLENVAMLDGYASNRYNTAFWTLVEEMRISIIFPALCWLVLRLRLPLALALVFGLALLAAVAEHALHSSQPRTLGYIGIFVCGILLARYRIPLEARLQELTRPSRYALLGISLVVGLCVPVALERSKVPACIKDLPVALAGCFVILFVLSSGRASRSLQRSAPAFLGKVSYSLYLFHGTARFLLGYLLVRWSPLQWLPIYLALSIGTAVLAYYLVEAPSQQLGKALTS